MFDYNTSGPPTAQTPAIPAPAVGTSIALDKANNVIYTSSGGVWVADAPKVLPIAKIDLTGQVAAIAATTIWAVPANMGGFYRVIAEGKITTADAASSTLGPFQLKYTDADDAVVVTTPTAAVTNFTSNAANTTSSQIGISWVINATKSTNIQYIMGYTSGTPATMTYSLHIRLEYLGT